MPAKPVRGVLRRPRIRRPLPAISVPPSIAWTIAGSVTDATAKKAVDARFDAALKEHINEAVDTTDKTVEALVDKLPIHYRTVEGDTIDAVIRAVVVPALLRDRRHVGIASALQARPVPSDAPTVKELLTPDVPLSEHPLFAADVRRSRSRELLRIAKLKEGLLDKIDALKTPLERWTDDDWAKAVADKVLTASEHDELFFTTELSRLTGEQYGLVEAARAAGLASPGALVAWDRDQWLDLVNKNAASLPPDMTPEEYADELAARVRGAFPSEWLAQRVTDRAAAQKLPPETIAAVYRHLGATSTEITPRIEALTRFFQSNAGEDLRFLHLLDDQAADWSGVGAADRVAVRNQLLALQRVLHLSDDPETAMVLLSAGLDSSADIVDLDYAEFRKRSGLTEPTSVSVYNEAQRRSTQMAHAIQLQKDAFSAFEQRRPFQGINPSFINDLKDLAGWEDLFGSTAYCECTHCRSIFSPAAYFTDLMYFIEKNITKKAFVNRPTHPLRLNMRRPDLWHLALTCDNTNTLIPHLTLVNEILESYLTHTLGIQNVEQALASDWSAIGLPFHAPLAEVRELLRDWNDHLAHLYAILDVPEDVILKETLLLSDTEWSALTASAADIAWIRFPTSNHSHMDVVDFLAFGSLTRDELDDLRATKTAGGFTITRVKLSDDIQSEKEVVEGLSNALLDRMGRFLRLARKTSFTLLELDEILQAERIVEGSPFSANGLSALARFTRLQRQLGLPVESLVAILDHIPVRALTHGGTSLVSRIGVRAFSGAGGLPVIFHHARFNTNDPADAEVDVRLASLLNVIGVTEAGLLALFTHYPVAFTFDSDGNVQLTADNVALLYAHATLARTWRMTSADLSLVVARLFALDGNDFRSLDVLEQLQHSVAMLASLPMPIADTFPLLDSTTELVTSDQVVSIVSSVQQSGARLFAASAVASLTGFTPEDGANVIAQLVAAGLVETVGDRYALTAAYTPASDLGPVLSAPYAARKDDIHSSLLEFHFVNLLPNSLAATSALSTEQTLVALAFVQSGWSDAAMLAALQTPISNGVPTQPDDLAPLAAVARDLARVSRLFNRLQLDTADLWFIAQYPSLFAIQDTRQLTVLNLDAIRRYGVQVSSPAAATSAGVRNLMWQYHVRTNGNQPLAPAEPFASVAAVPVFARALASPLRAPLSPATAPTFTAEVLVPSPLNADEIVFLADRHDLNPTLLRSVFLSVALPSIALDGLSRARTLHDLCQRMRIQGASLNTLARRDFSGCQAAAGLLLTLLEDKYRDNASREKYLEPHTDALNMRRRDALCNFIIARAATLKFRTHHDLYEYFLIDVDMGGCFRTSRLVAALSSLQLYVHRCLLNLEQSEKDDFSVLSFIDAEDISQEWEWRQNYRVWEANRKVFLYPESYIEPELRDNKTPLFRELEDDLLQRNITLDAAESAYHRYLVGFSILAQLKIVGACHDADRGCYWFVARTQADPYEYYLRRYETASRRWDPWEKIELGIGSPYASPIVHLGRLYLFWVDVSSMDKTSFVDGHSIFQGIEHRVTLHYANREASGQWGSTQKKTISRAFLDRCVVDNTPPFIKDITGYTFLTIAKGRTAQMADYYRSSKTYEKVIPTVIPGAPEKLTIHYFRTSERSMVQIATTVPAPTQNNPAATETTYDSVTQAQIDGMYVNPGDDGEVVIGDPNPAPTVEYSMLTLDLLRNDFSGNSFTRAVNATAEDVYQDTSQGVDAIGILEAMNGDVPYFTLMLRDHAKPQNPAATDAMLITANQEGGTVVSNGIAMPNTHDVVPVNDRPQDTVVQHWKHQHFIRKRPLLKPRRVGIRVNTTLDGYLSEVLFTGGIEEFLTLKTQTTKGEDSLLMDSNNASALGFSADPWGKLPYAGAFGDYYRELFFHIPFLIANQLNSRGRYKDAKYWYEKIFNPTAPAPGNETDVHHRVWQYLEFRDVDVPKLKELLNNDAAIEQYQENPFNPHAIARLRLSAYQKSIVIKYVDNLIDWADDHFTQDTMESVNTAMMLYVLAGDILGPRPVSVGTCKTAAEGGLTYQKLGPAIEKGSEFLVFVENLHLQFAAEANVKQAQAAPAGRPGTSNGLSAKVRSGEIGSVRTHMLKTRVPSSARAGGRKPDTPSLVGRKPPKVRPRRPAGHLLRQYLPAFCVPPNETLMALWDRIDDRLFKVRNCMNILGERRSLGLFQPPIDPMLLVRATAMGLSIEEVMGQQTEALPAYRFTYLVEKSRQYIGTVQAFGSALATALDKKDGAELELLHATQEKNLLALSRSVKRQQIETAQADLQALLAQQRTVEKRIEYYSELATAGLTSWEVTEQIFKHTATSIRLSEASVHLQAGIAYLIPQLGSPFAMKYGGKELGDSFNEFAGWASTLASISDTAANSAGLEGRFQRRAQEWEQQLTQAQQELKAVLKQVLGAEIRTQIAQKDLEIHDTQIEQSREVYDFLKGKFGGTGLQTFLSAQLMRLYRESYQMAARIARQAERAYQFERDASDFFIQSDNWQSERSGLLAGDRLLLQLQRLERAYMEGNTRELEVTQSFSLLQIAPSALQDLQQTGACSFSLDEIFFDISYPGQYRRLLRSVRVTIPSIVGPYTNVGAILRLEGSQVRRVPESDTALLVEVPLTMTKTIATSHAQNDAGLFTLDFRDERYLPFEGAGAISRWKLELPSTLRTFDYATIADVIVHLSYAARHDGAFGEAVQTAIASTLQTYAQQKGLFRLVSLRHEFPDAFYQLMNPPATQPHNTTFQLESRHFPMWLDGKTLQTLQTQVWPRPAKGKTIDVAALSLTVAGQPVGNWTPDGKGAVSVSGSPISPWHVTAGTLDKAAVDDLLFLFKYATV